MEKEEIILESESTKGFVTARKFSICRDGEQVWDLEHFHFKGWPDFEMPLDEAREDLRSLLTEAADFLATNLEKAE